MALRVVICPFPFREPVPTTPATTLELQHVSATVGADPIDDRGDNPIVLFSRHSFYRAHKLLVPQMFHKMKSDDNDARHSLGLHMSVNLPPVLSLSRLPCWFATEVRLNRLLPRCLTCLQPRCQCKVQDREMKTLRFNIEGDTAIRSC